LRREDKAMIAEILQTVTFVSREVVEDIDF
jgi:hypothetical protein